MIQPLTYHRLLHWLPTLHCQYKLPFWLKAAQSMRLTRKIMRINKNTEIKMPVHVAPDIAQGFSPRLVLVEGTPGIPSGRVPPNPLTQFCGTSCRRSHQSIMLSKCVGSFARNGSLLCRAATQSQSLSNATLRQVCLVEFALWTRYELVRVMEPLHLRTGSPISRLVFNFKFFKNMISLCYLMLCSDKFWSVDICLQLKRPILNIYI